MSSGCIIISAPSFKEEINYAPKISTKHNNMSGNRQKIWCTGYDYWIENIFLIEL